MEEGGASGEGREDAARKDELIGKILELQNTLHDLTQRVNSVKEENATLKAENDVRAISLTSYDVTCANCRF